MAIRNQQLVGYVKNLSQEEQSALLKIARRTRGVGIHSFMYWTNPQSNTTGLYIEISSLGEKASRELEEISNRIRANEEAKPYFRE